MFVVLLLYAYNADLRVCCCFVCCDITLTMIRFYNSSCITTVCCHVRQQPYCTYMAPILWSYCYVTFVLLRRYLYTCIPKGYSCYGIAMCLRYVCVSAILLCVAILQLYSYTMVRLRYIIYIDVFQLYCCRPDLGCVSFVF